MQWFHARLFDVGTCYTFNTECLKTEVDGESLRQTTAGQKFGLHLTLDVQSVSEGDKITLANMGYFKLFVVLYATSAH